MNSLALDYTIAQEVKIPTVLRGEAVLFVPVNGLLLVQACQRHQVGVLGIDAFKTEGPSIQPSDALDLSTLYQKLTWESFQQKSCGIAEEFIRQLGPHVDLLEFVLATQ